MGWKSECNWTLLKGGSTASSQTSLLHQPIHLGDGILNNHVPGCTGFLLLYPQIVEKIPEDTGGTVLKGRQGGSTASCQTSHHPQHIPLGDGGPSPLVGTPNTTPVSTKDSSCLPSKQFRHGWCLANLANTSLSFNE